MKRKFSSLMALLVFFTGMVINTRATALAAVPVQQELPLRSSETAEVIIADLENFIPEFMRQQDIPGVGIALIQDGKMVWAEGFGVTNTVTRQPVTPETLFEVASNSKVVTAYIALRLVDQGLLTLDEPLNAYLPEPWLPPSEYRDVITMRHVLSHTSGLGHSTTSRENLFAPGRGYSYSAVGFQYLQAVIEQVTGQSLEQVAQEMVYTPLGMPSSSFINRADLTPRTANGHLHALLPAVIFIVAYLVSLLVVGLIGLVITRLRTGRWRPGQWGAITIYTVAFAVALVPIFVFFSIASLMEFAWLIAACGLVLTFVFVLALLAGRKVITQVITKRAGLQGFLTTMWSILILAGLLFLAGSLTNLPVPKWPQTEVQGAGSLRATVGDMANFLIEISSPRYLSEDLAAQMQTSQVRLSSDLFWGLGPGIQYSQQGDALWQWGQHLDFQSIMIVYPEQQFGVVVCTNNDFLNPDTALEIAHRALGGKIEPIRQGLNLQFNYRESD